MTLADAVEEWLKVKTAGSGLHPHTIRNAARRVAINDLTADAVRSGSVLRAACRCGGQDPARLHGTLSGLFAYLIGQGLLTVDPLTAAGLERPKVARRLPRYIDKPSEFANVITTAAIQLRPLESRPRGYPNLRRRRQARGAK